MPAGFANVNARQLARISEFYLQEAIVEVLDGAGRDGLRLGGIAKVLGLPGAGYNAVITGQLHILRDRQ